MWKELVSEVSDKCKFHPPLSEEWIGKGLADFDVPMNASLKSFLLETDGLYDYGQFLWIVWNVRDLAAYNKEMRVNNPYEESGHTFDDIFFISNAGVDGILFGFPIIDGVMQEHIVAFYPIEGERINKADNLEIYLTGFLHGGLMI